MSVTEKLGDFSQTVLAPAADLARSWAGDSAWGVAVLMLSVAWQVPLWHWVVRSSKARIVRTAVTESFTEGLGAESDARVERRKQLRAALELHKLRSASDLTVGLVRKVLSILLAVVVLLWSRTGPAADYAFAGLDDLHGAPIRSGMAGVAWALALAVAATADQVVLQRVAGVRDRRAKFFATRMAPVIFGCLGLFLPGGTVVAFTAVMFLGLIGTVTAARDGSLTNLNESPCAAMVSR